jgi:hypothetical protein
MLELWHWDYFRTSPETAVFNVVTLILNELARGENSAKPINLLVWLQQRYYKVVLSSMKNR